MRPSIYDLQADIRRVEADNRRMRAELAELQRLVSGLLPRPQGEIKPWNFLPSVRYESDLPPHPAADDEAIMVLTSEPGASLGYTELKLFVAVGGEWKEVIHARS